VAGGERWKEGQRDQRAGEGEGGTHGRKLALVVQMYKLQPLGGVACANVGPTPGTG
jgi:hypothetical protein